jgi:hypothetical protein
MYWEMELFIQWEHDFMRVVRGGDSVIVGIANDMTSGLINREKSE